MGGGVEGLDTGQRVLGGSRFGCYAELVTANASEVIPHPEEWSYEQGAAVPVTYATAYAGLVRYGALQEGEAVLVHAAAGGVGTAATQIAKLRGASAVYGTASAAYGTASAAKHEAIRELGVDHPIDYRDRDFVAEVRRIAGDEHPLDLVMDAVGGRSFRKSFSLLRTGGRLVCFGASAFQRGERRSVPRALRTLAEMPRFNPLKLMSQSKSVIGVNMLALLDAKGSLEEYVEPLRGWMDSGSIQPVVAEAFPLERGPEAHRYMHDHRNVGKVVLTL